MSVDYDSIREENIGRYGWDTAVLDLLGQLYSERTHFIFELIQNAEDAGASELTFRLFEDRLEVSHDGRDFNESDVRGICGVGKSTKAEDLTRIGKFGIGFKSVYAYTRTPRVHSGTQHFRIESYVRPFAEDGSSVGSTGTLFIFPFDHDEQSPETATEQIGRALDHLELGTLLFLRSIERIRVSARLTGDFTLERVESARTKSSRHVALTESRGAATQDEEWFVWQRSLGELGYPAQRVEMAFPLADDPDGPRLAACRDSPLVVYFPTEKETFLGFLMQGPYRTTPARDNVPDDDPWNRSLVQETAALLSDVLVELRDEGLLSVDVLEAMPLDVGRFGPTVMFRAMFDSAVEAFVNQRLIPIAGGGYDLGANLKLARTAGLRELLSPSQLGGLYGVEGDLHFVHESITADRTQQLWKYLREVVHADEVTPESFVAKVTEPFLTQQSDQWMGRFYGFLHQNSALLRASRWYGDPPGAARLKPILRLEDGSQVLAFDAAGHPAAYLPGPTKTSFPTVRSPLVEIPEARQFLEGLKFTEPDVVAEVLDNVLPRYDRALASQVDLAQHVVDLSAIERALSVAVPDRRRHLSERLRSTAFLLGKSAVSGEVELKRPSSLYLRTDELAIYFAHCAEAWFALPSYQRWREILVGLGVRQEVAVTARPSNSLGYVELREERGWHERGVDGFDPSADIEGLQFALLHPEPARSEYVWNVLLAPNRHLLCGVVESCSRVDFSAASRSNLESVIGRTARTLAWLPTPHGAFCEPAKLSLDDLPPSYKRDEVLAKALGMVPPVVEEASRQLGLPVDLLRGLRENPDLVAKLAEELIRRASAGHDDIGEAADVSGSEAFEGDDVDYVTRLTDAFDRPGRAVGRGEGGVEHALGAVANPAVRRARIRGAIEEDRDNEPDPVERFSRVPLRVWEAKDNSVREFLLQQYGGRCQICDESFVKRDLEPYFEGLYLVSRTEARWIDRPGNVLCLCPTCCAKFQHGSVEAPDVLEQLSVWRTQIEGGKEPILRLGLCGQPVEIRFTEKHLLDLQEIVR